MTVSNSKNRSIIPRNTLAALYKANGKEVIVVPPTLANGSKYIYQIDQGASDAEDEDEATAGPSASQIKLQALVPQQMAFSVGKMGIIIFDNSSLSPTSSEHVKSIGSQTERVLQSLSPEQRPELIFQYAPDLLEARFLKHPLAVCTPIDALESYNVAIPLETSYTLLTKETLARSSIPGPKSKILAVDLPASASDEIHNEWLRSTVSALCSQISTHPVPFVLKFTQTISGHGVHIIHTLSERAELCNVTLPPLLHRNLQCLNSSNAHLRPCNLVLTDLIPEDEVVANYSLTFFVHCEGSWTSHCFGKQHVTDRKGSKTQYAGTSVDYAVQSELRGKLHSTIQSITDLLHGEGYYGPVGADVLETRDGKQYVIDLNVRWTSSWILGTLRKHFYGSGTGLGLRRARLVMMHFEVGMKEFEEVMDEELSEGRVVVVARFEMGGKSWVHLVVGGWEWGDVERVVGKMNGLCGGEAEEDGD